MNVGKQDAQTGRKQFDANIRGIQEGNLAAIARAGESQNPAYIPYLRAMLTAAVEYGGQSPAETQAIVALLKLGDHQSMLELECSLLTVEPEIVNDIAGKLLPKVKGWFAVRQYFFLLDQDEIYTNNLKRPQYNTDALFGGIYPSHWAVRYLSEVVPWAPFPAIHDTDDPRIPQLAQQWKSWIRNNRHRLERLRPQGRKGLTFSSAACPVEK